ncbi:MAG TPA: putative ABC exporter domain-containing protein [Fimbriimonadaceae bacterium]|nr:putative ABC exporter domain-containing protein [Fimbriimonadaceae bacterium]
MRALLFLTLRTTFNGIKRSVTSARRLISLLAFLAYYFLILNRGYDSPRRPPRFGAGGEGQLAFPPLEILDAIVFGGFAFLSLILALGMFSNRGSFRPADVDVLFPTPISPRVVLVFRLVRDYLLTLIMPLLLAIFAMRPMAMGWEAMFRNMPQHSELAGRAILVSWLLMALVWVAIGYAVSLFTGRSDRQSDRNARLLGWGFAVAVCAIFGYIYAQVRTFESAADWLELSRSPVLRAAFFPATFSSMIVMGPLQGNLPLAVGGLLAFLAVIGAAITVAMTQVGWMYDQAAARGFAANEQRTLQQQGDMFGIVAAQARLGKVKAGKKGWVHRLRLQGPLALLWKEYFLQRRGMFGMVLLFVVITLAMSLLPALIPERRGEMPSQVMFLLMQGFSLFILVTTMAQSGFIEVLRRVDLQKPLPFSAPTIVFYEVASKAMAGIVANWLAALVVVILKPAMWHVCLAAALMVPSLALLLSAVVFLVIVLFPDIDDPTQRGFRGLMMMLGVAIAASPGIVLFAGIWLWALAAPLAALPALVYFLAMAILVSIVAGRFYLTYNPSE